MSPDNTGPPSGQTDPATGLPGAGVFPAPDSAPETSTRFDPAPESFSSGFAPLETARSGAALPSLDQPGAIPGELVLRFARREDYAAFLESAKAHGLTLLGRLDALGAARIRLDDAATRFLEEHGADLALEPNFWVRIPDLPYRIEDRLPPGSLLGFGSTALEWLGIGERESLSLGQGVTVAVIDGGVRPDAGFGDGQVASVALTAPTASAPGNAGGGSVDPQSHGTGVASIVAGRRADVRGVAPGARILDFAIAGPDGTGSSFALAEAIVRAADAGARVINMSVGAYGDSPLVRAAVAYAAGKGVALVAAAGNQSYNEVAYPARYPGVVAVGAVDALGQQLPFSNSGQTLDLSAPGLAVRVAQAGGQTAEMTGTSAGAPFVSGALAAVLSRFPGLSAPDAVSLLIATSNDVGAPGPDPAFGAGLLNLGRALRHRQPGIRDAAVASHYPTHNRQGQPAIQVVVENRGTAPLHNLLLTVDLGGRKEYRTFPFLQPGASDFRELTLPVGWTGTGRDGGALTVSSRVTGYGGADADADNDSLRTVVRFPGR